MNIPEKSEDTQPNKCLLFSNLNQNLLKVTQNKIKVVIFVIFARSIQIDVSPLKLISITFVSHFQFHG